MVPLLKAVDEYSDGANLVFISIGWEEVIEVTGIFVETR